MKLTPGLGFAQQAATLQIPDITGIANLAAWYDAADISTITQAAGAISQWNDKSGNGNHATQATTAAKPGTGTQTLNGKNILGFNGTSSRLICPSGLYPLSNADNTSFVVYKTNAPGTNQCIYFGSGSGDFGHALFTPYQTFHEHYPTSSLTATAANNAPHIGLQRKAGSVQQSFNDGAPSPESAAISFNMTGLSIGSTASGSNFFNGSIAEILHYSRALNVKEINQVLAYLSAKWGIAAAAIDRTLAFGDSITAGTGASDAAHRWANLVAASIPGTTLNNKGIPASVLQDTVPNADSVPTGRSRYVADTTGNNLSNRAYVLYGVNDIYHLADYPTLNVTAYQTDLDTVIAGMVAGGYAASNIVIGSPPFFVARQNTPLHIQYVAAANAVAAKYHTKYADVYQAMINGGGSTLLDTDNLHPNNAGHAVIATAMQGAAQL